MRNLLMIYSTALIVLIIPAVTLAQPVDSIWARTFYNGGFDSLNWVQETTDGGFILVGCTKEMTGKDDINLIKTDSDGNLEWNSVIGDTDYECGYHVLETYDGGYLVSANSYAFNEGVGVPWIVKTDSDGDTLWTYAYAPENYNGFPLHAIQTYDSSFAVTGCINTGGDNQAFILLLDQDGNFIDWQEYGGDTQHQDGCFITQMPDSGFIVTGSDNNLYTTGNYDFRAFRVNKFMGVVWDSSYAITSSYDGLQGACKIDDGIVMVGIAGGYGWAMKIDFDGNTIWSKNISYAFANEAINAVCPTEDGGFMVGGWVGVAGHARDFSFTKLNPDGDTLWQHTVGAYYYDHGESLVATADGGFVMAGTSSSFYDGTCSYLVKIDDYLCGDASGDGSVNIADASYIINWIFFGGPAPDPLLSGDASGDGNVNIADASYIINYIFFGGPGPCEL